jgi:hypothetical protein
LDNEVRRLIEEQHKAMLKQLCGGAFDAVIRERLQIGSAQVPAAAEVAAKSSVAEPTRVDSAIGPKGAISGPSQGDTAPSLDEVLPSPETPLANQAAIPAFGEETDSEKPLDEVILEYLVEKARGRSDGRENRPARPSRSKE